MRGYETRLSFAGFERNDNYIAVRENAVSGATDDLKSRE
jgi:hypothetical protein